MLHCHTARDTLVRLECYHTGQEIKPVLVQVLGVLREWDTLPLRECRLEIWQFESSWPVALIRSALNLEDLKDLIDFRISSEKCLSLSHLSIDAANGPNIDWG